MLKELVRWTACGATLVAAIAAGPLALAETSDATTPPAATEEKAPAAKLPVRVLYAGNPGSAREEDFVKFLEEHFATVERGDYEKFVPEDAAEVDVVIFDWTSIYPRDEKGAIDFKDESIKSPTPPAIDGTFSRPAILIGGAGGTLSHKLNCAINWKCLCLDAEAHDVAVDHEIFEGPLPVKLEWTTRSKPVEYYLAPGMASLEETFDVWPVQKKTFPEIDPGLVSSAENFTGTPDAEVISGGINGKGPTSVAIGRHGNFLLWGFSGQPSDMTASGRQAFANAVCYIKKFDGQPAGPIGSDAYAGRDSWLASVYYLRCKEEAYLAKMVEKLEEMLRMHPAPEEMLKQIGDDKQAYMKNMMEPAYKSTLERVPQVVRDECGDAPGKIVQYYQVNLEYLRLNYQGGFDVDEEVRSLGVSNRSTELLETCVAMLEKGDQPELAERVLVRYSGENFESAQEWREWLDRAKEGLRFDEANVRFRAP